MKWPLCILCIINFHVGLKAQSFDQKFGSLIRLELDSGVVVSIDEPANLDRGRPTKLICYALPNGNTTAQTFGKMINEGDDWHFNIQHIGAQTAFIRHTDPNTNYIVVYLENKLRSWPTWRRQTKDGDQQIEYIVRSLIQKYNAFKPAVTLCGHSGGGSFIFGYLNAQPNISLLVERIGFLDATYAYETEKHLAKLSDWLKQAKNSLQVVAYNDSVVVYNGKPLVSPTGGTWYRSKLMARDLDAQFRLKFKETADKLWWYRSDQKISIKLVKNPKAEIFHTVLVEKNGLIDLLFNGTKFQDRKYLFWGDRAYRDYILR